jgi:hypothetical protein
MKMDDTIANLSALERRANGIREWLEKNGRGCFEEQEHIHAETKGKIYWHYGYMCALVDALNFLRGDTDDVSSAAPSDSPPLGKCN